MDTSKWHAAVKLITERLGQGGKTYTFDRGDRWTRSFSMRRYFYSRAEANDLLLEWATVATVCETSFNYHAYPDDGGYVVEMSISVTREADDDEIAEEKARLAATTAAPVEGNPV